MKELKTNPYYIEKLPPAPSKCKGKEKVCKEVTYVTAKLSGYWDKDSMTYGQAMTVMLKEWATLVVIWCAHDSSCTTALIVLASTDLKTPPLTMDSKKPANKDAVAIIYSDNFYLSQ
jgi:hypothetical protein